MKNICKCLCLVIVISIGCKKTSFLDKKPDESFITLRSLADFQKVLNNMTIMNIGVNPSFGEAGCDDYYSINLIRDAPYGESLRNLYYWQDNKAYTLKHLDWDYPYRTIMYANLVLDGLKKYIPSQNELSLYNEIKGKALFFRAEKYFQLAQIFAPPFENDLASIQLGLPLRSTSYVTEKLVRASLSDTYNFILADLKNSVELLKNIKVSEFKTQPSLAAAHGLLSRIFLILGEYDAALLHSNSCLELKGDLMDYNSSLWIDRSLQNPFKQYNSEVIYHSTLIQSVNSIFPLFLTGNLRVDSMLVQSYAEKDLRKSLYFKKELEGSSFIGSYDGTEYFFGGIATDEIYLNRAECYARTGDIINAMNDLNTLMLKRWKNDGSWTPFTAVNSTQALSIILNERRKELLFRGLRWPDIRRLNKEGANITLRRIFEGKEYILPPNDNRYTYLIPPDVIGFHPDMKQNPR